MKYILILLFLIPLSKSTQDTITEYLKKELKDIEVKGTLLNKLDKENVYIFEIKSNSSAEIVKIALPNKVYNAKEIYEFIETGDYFYKVKGELRFRLGHKFSGNIDVKQFKLLAPENE